MKTWNLSAQSCQIWKPGFHGTPLYYCYTLSTASTATNCRVQIWWIWRAIAMPCNTLQHTATNTCATHTATHMRVYQNDLQSLELMNTARDGNALQHTATHTWCNTLQHTYDLQCLELMKMARDGDVVAVPKGRHYPRITTLSDGISVFQNYLFVDDASQVCAVMSLCGYMYVCIHTYQCICIWYIYIYTCVSVYVYIREYIYIYICLHIFLYMYVYVWIYI